MAGKKIAGFACEHLWITGPASHTELRGIIRFEHPTPEISRRISAGLSLRTIEGGLFFDGTGTAGSGVRKSSTERCANAVPAGAEALVAPPSSIASSATASDARFPIRSLQGAAEIVAGATPSAVPVAAPPVSPPRAAASRRAATVIDIGPILDLAAAIRLARA
jgi:hypothetical protein